MILKIQRPVVGDGLWLAYNESKSTLFNFKPHSQIRRKMGDRYKAYFHAIFKNGNFLGLSDEAPEQNW
jgi:hypothetical protein